MACSSGGSKLREGLAELPEERRCLNIVLNYCRWLHDLYRGYPSSKREGATWAKATLDPRWSGLIDGAWAGRADPAFQVRQPADSQAFEQTLEFLRDVLEAGRSMAARLQLPFHTYQSRIR